MSLKQNQELKKLQKKQGYPLTNVFPVIITSDAIHNLEGQLIHQKKEDFETLSDSMYTSQSDE